MITCLAQEKLAFRGTLKDMCEFLGISNQVNNKSKIKAAIEKLKKQGDIKVVKEGNTWTLTLSLDAEQKPKVIKIKNEYINAIKKYKAINPNESVGWENILKIMIFLWTMDGTEIYTQDEIAKATNISSSTVGKAIKALTKIKFSDISLEKKVAWYRNFFNGQWRPRGTTYQIGYDWSEK